MWASSAISRFPIAGIDVCARRVVHDGAHHGAEASHRLRPGLLPGRAETRALAVEQLALQGGAGGGEGEQALPAISAAGGLGDIALLDKRSKHASERLLGDAQ